MIFVQPKSLVDVNTRLQLVDLHLCKSDDLADELTTYAVSQLAIDACSRASTGPSFIVRLAKKQELKYVFQFCINVREIKAVTKK